MSTAVQKERIQKRAIYQKKRAGASRWANKWVQSPAWFLGFAVVVAVCFVVYALNIMFGRVHPGSTWGLGYGIAAAVLFVAVFLYGVKRRTMKVRALGRAWYYLQFHVYGGALFLVLMLMHVRFEVPHGVLTWWLWALSLWVVGTGLLGIVIQKWIPTLLAGAVRTEVNYDRIPELVADIRERAEKVADGADYAVQEAYRDELAVDLEAPQFKPIYFLGIAGGLRGKASLFNSLRRMHTAEERERVTKLEELYSAKMDIDAHYTLQKALRGWLYLHVPVSVIALGLLGFHIFTVLYY
jgi:hypothetical protein